MTICDQRGPSARDGGEAKRVLRRNPVPPNSAAFVFSSPVAAFVGCRWLLLGSFACPLLILPQHAERPPSLYLVTRRRTVVIPAGAASEDSQACPTAALESRAWWSSWQWKVSCCVPHRVAVYIRALASGGTKGDEELVESAAVCPTRACRQHARHKRTPRVVAACCRPFC